MLALITKADDDFWYKLEEVDTIEDLFNVYPTTVVTGNEFKRWSKELFLDCWDGIKEEDIPLIQNVKCHIIIYNDYIE